MNGSEISQWNGNVFISRRRIIFVGQGGNTEEQTIHGIKICLALDGEFELIIGSKDKGDYYSAAIINAGITHLIKCNKSKIFLLYLLPESQEAREIRWEYLNNDKDNRKAGVYDIPKELIEESLPFLPQILRDYSDWNCQKAFQESDKIIRSLGQIRRRDCSTSSALAEKLNESVKKTINYIYDEIEAQIKSEEFDLSRFETSVICREIKLSPRKVKWLENEFRNETGTTIGHFFRDIQMLAAFNLYAILEAPRRDKERARKDKLKEMGLTEEDLIKALEDPSLTPEERREIGELLEETPRGFYLTQIAKSVGFGELANFDARIKSRIGISYADLRGESNFFSCDE
jgi:AraC-like DNA-binding protein